MPRPTAHTTVVIVPTFNNAATLRGVLAGVEVHGLAMLVVDDGSTDATSAILGEWANGDRRADGIASDHRPGRRVVSLPRNGGKANALRVGFVEARRLGFIRAATIDADGQHDPAELPSLLAAAEGPGLDTFVRGRRNDNHPGYPARRLLGRRLNDLAIRAQTGLRVTDSPCGYRVYPLAMVETIGCLGGRYAWEEEVITRAAWRGWPIVEVPVATRYAERDEAVSHYRFARDWPEGVLVNLWLLGRIALPIAPLRRGASGPLALSAQTRLRRWLADGLLRGDRIDRWHLVASLVAGVSIGVMPMPIAWLAALAVWLSWRWCGSLWCFVVPVAIRALVAW